MSDLEKYRALVGHWQQQAQQNLETAETFMRRLQAAEAEREECQRLKDQLIKIIEAQKKMLIKVMETLEDYQGHPVWKALLTEMKEKAK